MQSKCIGFLSNASAKFPANRLVLFMSEQFKNLNEDAIKFAIELLSDNADSGNHIFQKFGAYFSFLNADNAIMSRPSNLSQVMQWLNSDVTNAK